MTETGHIRKERIDAYRAKTFRIEKRLRIHDRKEAVAFINERGFIYFWPIKNVLLPSLWVATVGDRPVPYNHDDPGHVTWGWKDGLLDKRQCYYGKLLRRNSTFLSLEIALYFYALSPNFGDYENDYLSQYKQGLMRMETKAVYEALLRYGPLHTLTLREKAHLSSKENKYRFDRALADLQAEMKILPVGIANAGRWGYAMIYDITARYYPELQERARTIDESEARKRILERYFESVGACKQADVQKLFRWTRQKIESSLQDGMAGGWLCSAKMDGETENYLVRNTLLD